MRMASRSLCVAISAALPSPRTVVLLGGPTAAVRFDLPVQVAAEGRYEVRGVLYATGPRGAM